MDLSKNKLDVSAEQAGVWVDVDENTSLLVARYLNPKHRDYVNYRMEPHRRLQRIGQLSSEVELEIEVDAMAKHILLDWKGLQEDGKELPYSHENAKRILSDKSLSWFMDMVLDYSRDLSRFKEEALKENIDNVKKLSNG